MKYTILAAALTASMAASAIDHPGAVAESGEGFALVKDGRPAVVIVVPRGSDRAVEIAAGNLAEDFRRVTGTRASVVESAPKDAKAIRIAVAGGKDAKRESYTIEVGSDGIAVTGSDRRGAVYGIYEISEQIGVSPWYDWADVPSVKRTNLVMRHGVYKAGSPAVEYRGIFLNDEAPCLTTWVKNTYGTDTGDHRFYARVGELILRLRGNFLWPAMWCWSFYADDPENSRTLDEMGVVVGTSHHEPMARNHQEWARNRKSYGAWNYATNKDTLDRFFAEGVARMKGTGDVVTIGMRGDGDEAMGEGTDTALMKSIIANQRAIIERETGRPAAETPQMWALYKEVQDYYDAGLRPPEDVMILLCDDNWGNVRRLPDAEERKWPGGWGMYYHVDYVGAPRNSKWINNTCTQAMWEQLSLTYEHGVDRMWILNVGDLKPMEYPITFFLDMARDPGRFTAENVKGHTVDFCRRAFGDAVGAKAGVILDAYTHLAARVTPEMLDAKTYNVGIGEWREVADEWARLELDATRLYLEVPSEARDAYRELVLFPVQAFGNLHQLYYATAMNHALADIGDGAANEWAKRAEDAFARDAELMREYNEDYAGGKWKGMMIQRHIGYTSWNDNFSKDRLPELKRLGADAAKRGGWMFTPRGREVVIDAEHWTEATCAKGFDWVVVPGLGRNLSGVTVRPATSAPAGCALKYRMKLPNGATKAKVTVVTRSTLPFARPEGHRYAVAFESGERKEVNFNFDLLDNRKYAYTTFYPTVARRVVEKTVALDALPPADKSGFVTLVVEPIDPGVVFERVLVDFGWGVRKGYLFGEPTPRTRIADMSDAPGSEGVARRKSYDSMMGEGWWMKRHQAVLADIGAKKSYDVVLVGDSITHRWERPIYAGGLWKDEILGKWKALNLGFGADVSDNALWRLTNGELDGYTAKTFQVLIGTNNSPEESAEATAEKIEHIATLIRERHPESKVVLVGLLPRGDPGDPLRAKHEAVNRHLEYYALAYPGKVEYVDIASVFMKADGTFNENMSGDKLHPSQSGFKAMYDALSRHW